MKLNKVVIILGKRLVHDQLSAEGRSRVEALVSVLNQWDFESTALVFCGGVTQGQTISEADAMYQYFDQLAKVRGIGFPDQQVIIESRSLNTVQNMQNAAKELLKSGLCPMGQAIEVILLSNDYHLERIIEIQTLMDEQGLLRVLKSRCADMGIELTVSLDIAEHISVPYPNSGTQADAFLLFDELTTYRVYLEGVKNKAFKRDLAQVQAKPLAIALKAIEKLQTLPLTQDVKNQIAEMKKAIEMTAFDDSVFAAQQALAVFHPILTALNQRLDPEASVSE
ncbi:YdcF family protein [Vibrio sp. Y29_XK_CS5]|uniref:YdcF family protein n=1 Tax=Vibrio sp. Y29_XK_CS5 TaxID=2957762 RepID=UPI0020A2F390|nr:YdcF family protein [Vibrio sp. Y29_XK_CS5]ELI6427025.1 YdcF family protein [Vibrio harveyi]